MLTSIVGYTAGSIVAIMQFPLVWDVYHKRTTVSKLSLAVHSTNGILWIMYGSMLNESPIIMANTIYLLSNMVLVYCNIWRSPSLPKSISTQTMDCI